MACGESTVAVVDLDAPPCSQLVGRLDRPIKLYTLRNPGTATRIERDETRIIVDRYNATSEGPHRFGSPFLAFEKISTMAYAKYWRNTERSETFPHYRNPKAMGAYG